MTVLWLQTKLHDIPNLFDKKKQHKNKLFAYEIVVDKLGVTTIW